MLLQQNGINVNQCAWYLNCSTSTVRKWSKGSIEKDYFLDANRSGRPLIFNEQMRLKTIAYYCQNPFSNSLNWSFRWAAEYFNNNPDLLGMTISASTINRILREHKMRPHMIKYFLQITDPDFFPKMEHIISLYLNPPDNLFCFDECTGLQALERLATDLKTNNGLKIEYQYRRHGTRDLCAILNYHTGEVFGKCTDNHIQETIVQMLVDHANQYPYHDQLHYICDNLAGHSTELFCRKVAELSKMPYPSGLNNQRKRRQWLRSSDKRIVIHFVPYHGSWLNMVEIWFGILKSKCLKGRSFTSIDELVEIICDFIYNWNEHFAHPFSWTYTGEGLAEKVVQRLINWLLTETKNMKKDFFYKQMLLMNNLVCDYWEEVNKNHWLSLLNNLFDKQNYIRSVIGSDFKTNKAYSDLIGVLLEKLPLSTQTESKLVV